MNDEPECQHEWNEELDYIVRCIKCHKVYE